ncbi:hypothetical protein CGCA056_v011184 [Colletotrichum aenigma]|uniref:uncharacterized protein n=1 Tax=Colletotrichum aenigma TaxID=1215731 RepID=UPI00187303D3|nr:uncharacterized protein CGCA056_v011184 [Colletotrichum aenigma]KAF5517867.1 hypothetical protein CGCA056_v011184 [Colletotrichum aenigma]
MAEALGLAASVIAVVDIAAKTGSAYFRLQRLWGEMENVPAMLLEKTEDIQIFEDFLASMEESLKNSTLPPLASNRVRFEKLIGRCHCTLDELKVMVDQIDKRVTTHGGPKHKIACAKVTLKRNEIDALTLKFDRALRMFEVAQAQECRGLAIATYTVIAQSTSNKLPSSSETSAAIERSGHKRRDVQRDEAISTKQPVFSEICSSASEFDLFGKIRFGPEKSGGFYAFVATPSWLSRSSRSVYSVLVQRATMGWQVNLRTYEVAYFDNTLLDVLSYDEPDRLYKYLHDHRLNIFVRETCGHSILLFAMYGLYFNIIEALINQGLDVDSGPIWYLT